LFKQRNASRFSKQALLEFKSKKNFRLHIRLLVKRLL